jgi:hypothetical protein
MRAVDLPILAFAIGREDKRTFAGAHEESHAAHAQSFSALRAARSMRIVAL